MAIRTISAFVALPLFFIVVYLLPPVCFPFFVSLISLIAVYELLWRSKIARNVFCVSIAYVYAFIIPLGIGFYFDLITNFVYPAIFFIAIVLFAYWIFNQKKLSFEKLAMTFFGAIVIPVFLSSLIRIFQMENGGWLILIPFIAAWLTDTGAYFTGVFFGKHKLAPEISPKKTVEGAVGGIIVCIASFVVYAFIIGITQPLSLIIFAGCGLVLSLIAQIGDLSMSLIKREYQIKDYGVLFPGHGGILDRFDSVLFTSPASLILLTLFTHLF